MGEDRISSKVSKDIPIDIRRPLKDKKVLESLSWWLPSIYKEWIHPEHMPLPHTVPSRYDWPEEPEQQMPRGSKSDQRAGDPTTSFWGGRHSRGSGE